jgi:hypothetical protein
MNGKLYGILQSQDISRQSIGSCKTYSASHLVAELFIGCVDPISSPKMEMYDQKNKS